MTPDCNGSWHPDVAGLTLVKPPNHRGRGCSSVYRTTDLRWTKGLTKTAYVKTQQSYFCRPIWRGFRRTPTARRELRALQALVRLGLNVPLVIQYEEQGSFARLTTTGIDEALPLHHALCQHPDKADEILIESGELIGHLHRAGWTHGALYPDHILVRSQPVQAFLIDLEKARRSKRRMSDLERLFRYLQTTAQAESVFLKAYQRTVAGASPTPDTAA